jgi:hypothetical protein
VVTLIAIACGGSTENERNKTLDELPRRDAPAAATPTGPSATIEPRNGPPGTQVLVRGSGWGPGETITVTGATTPGNEGRPYAMVMAGSDGSFSARFLLEKTPAGTDLQVGRFEIIAAAGQTEVRVPFQVDARRTVGVNPGPGPGG